MTYPRLLWRQLVVLRLACLVLSDLSRSVAGLCLITIRHVNYGTIRCILEKGGAIAYINVKGRQKEPSFPDKRKPNKYTWMPNAHTWWHTSQFPSLEGAGAAEPFLSWVLALECSPSPGWSLGHKLFLQLQSVSAHVSCNQPLGWCSKWLQ